MLDSNTTVLFSITLCVLVPACVRSSLLHLLCAVSQNVLGALLSPLKRTCCRMKLWHQTWGGIEDSHANTCSQTTLPHIIRSYICVFMWPA